MASSKHQPATASPVDGAETSGLRRWLVPRRAAGVLWWLACGWMAFGLVTSVWMAFAHGTHAFGTLHQPIGDSIPHVGATILFGYRGWAVYREPLARSCSRHDQRTARFARRHKLSPAMACDLPERKGHRPLLLVWQHLPRAYPPGAFLYYAPAAALYQWSDVSVRGIGLFLLILCVLSSHWVAFLVMRDWLRPVTSSPSLSFPPSETREEDPSQGTSSWWRLGLFVVLWPQLYGALVVWSLAGLYDAVAIGFVCLAASAFSQRRDGAVFGYMALALSLHFRAIWYVPLLGLVVWRWWRQRGQRAGLEWRRYLLPGAVWLLLVGTSFVAFVTIAPVLSSYASDNVLQIGTWRSPHRGHAFFACGLCLILYTLWKVRALELLVVVGWVVFVLLHTHQLQQWHALFLLPLFCLAARQPRPAVSLGVMGAGFVAASALWLGGFAGAGMMWAPIRHLLFS